MSGSGDSAFTAVAGAVKEEVMEEVNEVKIEVEEEIDDEFEGVFTAMMESVHTEAAEMMPVIVEGEVREVKMEVDEKIEEVKKEIKEEVEEEVEEEFEEVVVPTTPQCVLCNKYPKTVIGYTSHLRIHHKSTLILNGIYLICKCGLKILSDSRYANHRDRCDGNQFSLHKLEAKACSTTQCLLCEAYPPTTMGYAFHLSYHHKTTLKTSGVYLLCSCGQEVRSLDYSKKCDCHQFTLHKLEQMTNPQCVLCEEYPSTASGYASHLRTRHKSTLNANEIYILCSCGKEYHSNQCDPTHTKKCDGKQFTLHKVKSPKCVMCEIYPKMANEYAKHLFKAHRTTLKKSGVYLICSCDREVRCANRDNDHGKKCDSRQFSLHKLDNNDQ